MEDFAEHQTLMKEVIAWADDSPDKWYALVETVKSRYVPTLPFSLDKLTPREVLLNWVSNRYGYCRGVATTNDADISFYKRVVAGLEKSVPMALSLDHGMAKAFTLKIMKHNTVISGEETTRPRLETP